MAMRALIRIGRHPLFASAAAVSISPPLVARPTLPAVPLGGPIAERQSPGDTAKRRALWWLAAAGVVLLGALLRLWRLDLAEFKLDELAVTRLVFALTQQGQWPARGIPSSLGTNNSPLVVYLLALPALVRPTPLALTAFVALLNVAGIAGTLWFARRFFGAVAALVAGVLFATTPWAVVYSRKIWEQDLLPPLVLLFFLGLFLVVVERKPRWLLLCGASAAIAVQLHPSAVVLPAIGLLALLRWPRRFPWRFLVLAAVVTLLLLLPYLLMESRIGFADWAAALSGTGKSHPGRLGSMTMSWLFWAEVASPWQVLGVFSPTGMSSGDPAFLTLGAWLAWAGLGAAVVSLLVVARRSDVARRPAGDSAVADTCFLLCLWLLMPPFLMGLSGQWVFPHYLIVVYPAPFLAVGVLVGRLWAGGRWRRAAGALLLWCLTHSCRLAASHFGVARFRPRRVA